MTITLSGSEIAEMINTQFPNTVIESHNQSVVIDKDDLSKVADLLKNSPELEFNYLTDLTAVDYHDYFEIVYRLTSLVHNRTLVLKVRCLDRQNPIVPSVTSVWKGADYLEREIFDLMGIKFADHPNLSRIVLWEGFTGHPLRKDYLQ